MRTVIAILICLVACPSRGEESPSSMPIESGMVVLQGELIESPYRVHVYDGELTINGRRVLLTKFLPRNGFNHVPRGTDAEHVAVVERFLLNEGTIIGFAFNEVAWFGIWNLDLDDGLDAEDALEFLAIISRENANVSLTVSGLMTRNIVGMEHLGTREWTSLIASFEPSDDLREFIGQSSEIDNDGLDDEYFVEMEDSSMPSESANPWLPPNTIRYIMTVCGMMLSVVAFGYLIQYRPTSSKSLKEQNNRRRAVQAVYVCLTFIVLLGLFDLVSTLGAESTLHFAELNPLGGWLLSSPTAATAFKLIATGLGVGLLLRYRVYIFAQLASWWMCLVSTLVVFRWVIFRAMMLE